MRRFFSFLFRFKQTPSLIFTLFSTKRYPQSTKSQYVCELNIHYNAPPRISRCSPWLCLRSLQPNHQARGIRPVKECVQRRSTAHNHSFGDSSPAYCATLPAACCYKWCQRHVPDQQANHLHSDGKHPESRCKFPDPDFLYNRRGFSKQKV